MALGKKVKRKIFIAHRAPTLKLFINDYLVDELVAADGEYKNCSQAVRAMVTSNFRTGVSMFKGDWLAVAKDEFLAEVGKFLRDLEHNDFQEDEIESFNKVMDEKAKTLRALGENRKLKWRCKLQLFGFEIQDHDVDDPRDAAFFQFWARVKDMCVNQGTMHPLLWEKLLVPQKSLDASEVIQMPLSVLNTILPARAFVNDLLADVDTLEQAIKIVLKNEDALLDLDRSFVLDILFLKQHAMAMLMELGEQAVLDCFDNVDGKLTFDLVLENLRNTLRIPHVLALGSSFFKEVDGIHDLVAQLQQGFPPRCKDIQSLSKLTQSAVNRCQMLCKIFVPEEKRTTEMLALTDGNLFGADAMKYLYAEAGEQSGKEGGLQAEILKPLKQFYFMLEPTMKTQVSSWLTSFTRQRVGYFAPVLKDTPKTPTVSTSTSPKSALAIVPAGSASSSSTVIDASGDGPFAKVSRKELIGSFFSSGPMKR